MWEYCSTGVWHDTRDIFKVRLVKTLNLTVSSFLNTDLQSTACALTYRTILAVVPALALAFAICRGFGFENLFSEQLYKLFPSQHEVVQLCLNFVDSYLAQASEGVFVGIGVLFLLWTLVSLLGNVEDSLNRIWRVQNGRTLWRKVTDYLAILLVLPILMICAAGLSILMGTALKTLLPFDFMGPIISGVLDAASYLFTWLFFAGAYMMIPNTRVRFLNAFVAGAVVGTAFQVIQWLFLTGQLYVAKYNAIYGSFSFLPLMLLWLQLTWLITLIGGLVCYASQHSGQFDFYRDVDGISPDYKRTVCVLIMSIISRRFTSALPPLTASGIADTYGLPHSLVREVTRHLNRVGLLIYVASNDEGEKTIQPALEVVGLTVGTVVERIQRYGCSDFIPGFETRYSSVCTAAEEMNRALKEAGNNTQVTELTFDINPNTVNSTASTGRNDNQTQITNQ